MGEFLESSTLIRRRRKHRLAIPLALSLVVAATACQSASAPHRLVTQAPSPAAALPTAAPPAEVTGPGAPGARVDGTDFVSVAVDRLRGALSDATPLRTAHSAGSSAGTASTTNSSPATDLASDRGPGSADNGQAGDQTSEDPGSPADATGAASWRSGTVPGTQTGSTAPGGTGSTTPAGTSSKTPNAPKPATGTVPVTVRRSATAPTNVTATTGSISVVSRGSRAHRWIALTFDDGWDPDRCRSIEKTLLRHNVPATWFPNAVYVRNAPTLWRHIAEHFPIANHTRSHPDLTTLSSDAIRHQIRSDEKIIEKITGRPMLKMLRPPYGAYNSTVLHVAAGLGYRDLVLWNVDDRDTQGASASQALADAERGTRGSIVLMHCGPAITPGILPSVIAYYRARGFRFVTLPTLLDGG